MKKFLCIFLITIFIQSVFSVNFSELTATVIDSDTLKEVSGVRIKVEDDMTFTDEKGEFYIDSLLSGANLISIEKEGYNPYSKVVFLFKGLNSKKFIISPKFKADNKKIQNIEKNSEEQEIEECKEKLENQKIDKSFWMERDEVADGDRIDNLCTDSQYRLGDKNSGAKTNNFRSIVDIIERLDDKVLVTGNLLEEKYNIPVKGVPVFINDSVVFTDEHGSFKYYSKENYINVELNIKGYEILKKKIRLNSDKNSIELYCVRSGGER